jgi:hypothetical protein
MTARGWSRIDPRPWRKLNARWEHQAGWRLEHCGHPTAVWPWALFAPDGEMVLTGVRAGNPQHGRAWPDLRTAVEWVAKTTSRSERAAVSTARA